MQAINITELRSHLPKYLKRAYKGDEILITSHGQVIARILPPVDTKMQAQEELKKLRKKCKMTDVISPINEKWDSEK